MKSFGNKFFTRVNKVAQPRRLCLRSVVYLGPRSGPGSKES